MERVRPPRAWLVTRHSGGLGAPPGRHYERSARSSLDGRGANAVFPEARPEVEPRPCGAVARAAVERREASGQRHWPHRASQAWKRMVRLSALRPPRLVRGNWKKPIARARMRRGKEKLCLKWK